MQERGISVEEVLAALHKRGRVHLDGVAEHYDPRSHVVVKVSPSENAILTIYRRRPRKQRYRAGGEF